MSTVRTVTIPACVDHEGVYSMRLALPWTCIHCGGPRGEPAPTISWDGSRRLAVDGWTNPCGHTELYSEIRHAHVDAGGELPSLLECGPFGGWQS